MRVWLLIGAAAALALGGTLGFRAQATRIWLERGLEDLSPAGQPTLGKRGHCRWAIYDIDAGMVAPEGWTPGPFAPTVPFSDSATPHSDHPANLCPRELMPPDIAAQVVAARDDPAGVWHRNHAGVWLWSPAAGIAALVGVYVP